MLQCLMHCMQFGEILEGCGEKGLLNVRGVFGLGLCRRSHITQSWLTSCGTGFDGDAKHRSFHSSRELSITVEFLPLSASLSGVFTFDRSSEDVLATVAKLSEVELKTNSSLDSFEGVFHILVFEQYAENSFKIKPIPLFFDKDGWEKVNCTTF